MRGNKLKKTDELVVKHVNLASHDESGAHKQRQALTVLDRDIKHVQKMLKIRWYEHIPLFGVALYELRLDMNLSQSEGDIIQRHGFQEAMSFLIRGLFVFSVIALALSPFPWKYILTKALKKGAADLKNEVDHQQPKRL